MGVLNCLEGLSDELKEEMKETYMEEETYICPMCWKKALVIGRYAPGNIERCLNCGYTDYDYNFDYDPEF